MKIYYLFLVVVLLACQQRSSIPELENYVFTEKDKNQQIAPADSLTFDYGIIYRNSGRVNSLDVSCALKNESVFLFYFYTQSCYGWTVTFEQDSSKLQVYPFILCETSSQVIKKIAPKSSFKFSAYFQIKDSTLEEKPTLNYYVYPVKPDFDFKNTENLKKAFVRNVKS